jgi:hypothetical protein
MNSLFFSNIEHQKFTISPFPFLFKRKIFCSPRDISKLFPPHSQFFLFYKMSSVSFIVPFYKKRAYCLVNNVIKIINNLIILFLKQTIVHEIGRTLV